MAIPGLKPSHNVVAKVRIGEKVSGKTKAGKEYTRPASTDHFVCDDPAFLRAVGPSAKSITVYLPFKEAADNFSTGLEWWQGKVLACYSKGEVEGGVPVALRVASMRFDGVQKNMLDGMNVLSDEVIGKERRKIECPVRSCPAMKDKLCKPMGRLQFWIEGLERTAGVYQIETKSWNSVEALEATLGMYPDCRNIPFKLTVSMQQKGRDHFPVLGLEASVEINNDSDVRLADALVAGHKAYDSGNLPAIRSSLASLLDLTTEGWRDNPQIVDRITEVTPKVALEKMLTKVGK